MRLLQALKQDNVICLLEMMVEKSMPLSLSQELSEILMRFR
jgi:hypothetical protein